MYKMMAMFLALSIMVSGAVLWSQEDASAHGGAWEGLPANQDKESPQPGYYIATQAGFPPQPSAPTTGASSGTGNGQEGSGATSSGTGTTGGGKSSGPYNGPINGTFNGTAGPGGTACCGTVNGRSFAGVQQNQSSSTCSGCTVNGNFNGTLNGTTVGNQFSGTINGTFSGTVNGTLSNAGGVGGPTSQGYPTTGQVQNASVTGTPVSGSFSGDPDTGGNENGSHGSGDSNGDK